MATTVGQHTVATFTSPVNGTTPIDANTVRGNDNTLRTSYNDHDLDTGIHVQSSTFASRPVAGTAGRKWITVDVGGDLHLWYDTGTNWEEVGNSGVEVLCIANSTLSAGDVVKIIGFDNGQSLPIVDIVDSADDVGFGVVDVNIGSGGSGYVVNTGVARDFDTSSFSVGDVLYKDASGGFTTTKPASGEYQPCAIVLRSNPSNGALYVEFSAPRIVERSDNTASTVVLRDASGNFAAGTITAGALTSTGLVTFASLKGTGATTVTNILDEDNMASNSATALATQQSIKAYVDSQVATVDTLAEILVNGNTSGGTNLIMSAGDTLTVNTIAETTVGAGVTIDSVLLKDDVVNATDIEVSTISANDGVQSAVVASATGVMTIASSVLTTTDINGGTVDGAVIGGASAAAGTFTTLTANTNLTIAGTTTVNGVIDDDTMATASATKLATSESIKVYVDSQVTAQDLDFAGDSGTGAVDLDSQTFTIAGTAGEIETSASGQTITVGLPTNVTIAGNLTVIGSLTAANGSAGAPTYSFSSDTDTGMYLPAVGRVALVAGSLEYLSTEIQGDPGDTYGYLKFGAGSGTTPAYLGTTGWSRSWYMSKNLVYSKSGATFSPDDRLNWEYQSGDTSGNQMGGLFLHRTNGSSRWDFMSVPVTTGGGTNPASLTTIFLISSVGTASTAGQVKGTDGSSALPFYSFISDPNTGIWSPAADTIAWSTAGAEKMRITSSGFVGIGTTAPLDIVHIKSTSNDARIFLDAHTAFDAELKFAEAGAVKYAIGYDAATQNFVVGTVNVDTGQRLVIDSSGNVGIGTTSPGYKLAVVGSVNITGALSKGSGSFKIEHPLPAKADTHNLVHSFIEGPRADLIYRGIVNLVDGFAEVDLDEAATMTTGTWELLCRDAQVFVQNESGWSLVRGSVSGSTLTINAQDNTSTDTASWIVVAERKDAHMMDTNWTDDNGRVIVEPLKEIKA